MNRRKLNLIIAYLSRMISAVALMIWGAVNIVGLAMQQMSSEVTEANWTASWIMCGIFGFVPFLLGGWLVFRNLKATQFRAKGDG